MFFVAVQYSHAIAVIPILINIFRGQVRDRTSQWTKRQIIYIINKGGNLKKLILRFSFADTRMSAFNGENGKYDGLQTSEVAISDFRNFDILDRRDVFDVRFGAGRVQPALCFHCC